MKIVAGTILVLTHGEYSDYSFDGPFRVLKEFDQAEAANEFRSGWTPEYEWEDQPDEREFIAWLSTHGFIEDMNAHAWHIGDYRFSPEIQTEPEAA